MIASPELRPARIRVPASTSNLGAGFDCLGLALDRYLTATYEPGPEPLRLDRCGTLSALAVPPEDDLFVRVFRSCVARGGGAEPTGVLRVDSEIPIGRGLGSSAAAVVAGIGLAAAAVRAGPLDRRAALRSVETWEGHPDNGAPALFGGLTAVARDERDHPYALPLPLSDAVGFAFAAPPVEVPTPAARAALPGTVPHAEAARQLGRLAALLQGLAAGDPELLRLGFADQLHVPHRLPLIPGAAAAMDAAREAGGWAVTISGSGSGLIAACAPDRAEGVAAAMAAAFRRSVDRDAVVAFPARPDWRGALLDEAVTEADR